MRLLHISSMALVVTTALAGCTRTAGTTTVYSPGGQIAERTVTDGNRVIAELHRVFDTTQLVGEGIFVNANEGLARQSALSLAQADLAQKVQSEVRGNTMVMNNEDVRSVVETSVNAVVRNYTVDSAGYDPNSRTYRVRISVRGEQLVKEIERRQTR